MIYELYFNKAVIKKVCTYPLPKNTCTFMAVHNNAHMHKHQDVYDRKKKALEKKEPIKELENYGINCGTSIL